VTGDDRDQTPFPPLRVVRPSEVLPDPVEAAGPSPLDWHALPADEVVARLDSGPDGLASQEAAERLLRHGPNALPEEPPPSALVVLVHQFQSPLILILLVAGVATLALGKSMDTIVIAVVLALNATIGFVQERGAERSVRALMHLVAARAHVIRDGREVEIPGSEVVPGDLVLLESGRRIPADVRLTEATTLAIDESLLTGESNPAAKGTAPVDPSVGLADRTSLAFTGSVVSTGRGRGVVVATGRETELGRIAELVRGEGETETPLQRRMTHFAHLIGVVVLVASAGTALLGLALGGAPEEMLLTAVSLAVAAVPEGLPVVFTITLALGVRRMARRRAIVRRLPAVETLGSTTVIGSDKTGTLTENRMTVLEAWSAGRSWSTSGDATDADEDLRLTLLTGVMTNEASLHETGDEMESQGDPTEVALLVAARHWGLDARTLRTSASLIRDIPFEPQRQDSATVRRHEDAAWIFVKGAPERVLAMCDRMLGPDGPVPLHREAVEAEAAAMADRGLRVLGMAYRMHESGVAAEEADGDATHPSGLVFAGLQGMQDPPREGVREAVQGCLRAGIRVVMITGDHASTARAIARDLGIVDAASSDVLSGADLAGMDDAELVLRSRSVRVYARVSPDQKLRIVRALQQDGQVVAVTGDGVNDAPALKAAEIGIAMGRSGTDVAREAAALAFEPGERDILEKPPRDPREQVMSPLLWERTVVAGIVMATGTFALFVWEYTTTDSLVLAQTVALTTMVVFQMFQVGNARSETRSLFRMSPFSNPFLLTAVAGAFLVHVLALNLPITQSILRVEPIGLDAWARILVVASSILVAMEVHKAIRRRRPLPAVRRRRGAA
jgi:Ca2+-transporting ATPase